MKFFLDSASLSEIKEASELGLLDGVTTNPSLVAKENKQKDFKTTIKEICKIVNSYTGKFLKPFFVKLSQALSLKGDIVKSNNKSA